MGLEGSISVLLNEVLCMFEECRKGLDRLPQTTIIFKDDCTQWIVGRKAFESQSVPVICQTSSCNGLEKDRSLTMSGCSLAAASFTEAVEEKMVLTDAMAFRKEPSAHFNSLIGSASPICH